MPASLALQLSVLAERLAVCRLPATAPLPAWVEEARFTSLTRTADELSVVCPEDMAPADIVCEKGWRALKVQGPLEFSLTGILAALSATLAEAGIPIFALSTFETDYILVKQADLEAAVRALEVSGHTIL